MSYYNILQKARENDINAIDLSIANEVDYQLGETLVDVLDSDEEKKEKFEKICELTWGVYIKTEGFTVDYIVNTIIGILYDKEHTIETITIKTIIDNL